MGASMWRSSQKSGLRRDENTPLTFSFFLTCLAARNMDLWLSSTFNTEFLPSRSTRIESTSSSVRWIFLSASFLRDIDELFETETDLILSNRSIQARCSKSMDINVLRRFRSSPPFTRCEERSRLSTTFVPLLSVHSSSSLLV